MSGLREKLLAFLVAVTFLSASGTALLSWGLTQHRADNAVINLAGAQRMLSQKLTKEAILLAEGTGDPKILRQSRDRFDKVLTGLLEGDPALGLPGHPKPAIQAQLRIVSDLWKPFRAIIDSLEEKPGKDSRLNEIIRVNPALLASANEAVMLLESDANAKVDRIIYMQIGLFLAVVTLLAVAWTTMLAPLLRQLATVVYEVTAAADAVSQAAKEVASSSDWLANSSTQQAAALEQTSAAAEEISNSGLQCKSSSAAAADVVTKYEGEFDRASETLADVVRATTEIGESTNKIAAVNKLIDGIAFQTNILALNAAVEAARAGEAGMGFSVVADEVRRLAHRSADASRDTATLVENSVAVAATGASKVGRASEAMSSIQSGWEQVRVLAIKINAASAQQFTGISQITQAVTLMQGSTQQTAAVSEESAAAALELRAQAESLQTVVSGLARIVNGR